MSSSAAYMREYRRRLGGLTAPERARLMAAAWVREHRPDLWAGMLEQAHEDIRNAAAESPSPAAVLPDGPPTVRAALDAASPGVVTPGVSSDDHAPSLRPGADLPQAREGRPAPPARPTLTLGGAS